MKSLFTRANMADTSDVIRNVCGLNIQNGCFTVPVLGDNKYKIDNKSVRTDRIIDLKTNKRYTNVNFVCLFFNINASVEATKGVKKILDYIAPLKKDTTEENEQIKVQRERYVVFGKKDYVCCKLIGIDPIMVSDMGTIEDLDCPIISAIPSVKIKGENVIGYVKFPKKFSSIHQILMEKGGNVLKKYFQKIIIKEDK